MELLTPCAGLRPGAAYPKRSNAACPPPRCVLDHKLNGNLLYFFYFVLIYPKRSKAAYPPPRCVLDHKLNGFIYSCAEFMVDEK